MKLNIPLIVLGSLVSEGTPAPIKHLKGKSTVRTKLELSHSPSAEECVKALGGSLSKDVLRWAFTSFSLKELNADGWSFEGVPRPDYISATRYWSELCDGSPECDRACPAEQVIIAGPAEGSDLYEEFISEILTGDGETFRTTGGDILAPYVGFESPDDLAEFVETHVNAIGIFDDATISGHMPLKDVPVTPSPLPSAYIAYAHPMTAETCMFALGGLSIAQLRWAFTDWTLKELQADGWDFTGVPTPDFISETRYWSELCAVGEPCETECPARQVKIAGPVEGTSLYVKFKEIILTGEGEIFRTEGGHVIDPYVSGSPEEVTIYLKENVDAVGVIKFKKYLPASDQITASPIALLDGGDYVTPSWVTIPPGGEYNKGDGSYPLGLTVVAVGAPIKTAKTCTYAISGGGGLTVSQLRWAFTSYSLKELVDNGWAFEGEVPSPDLVSDTRYWSELCDGSDECVRVCAPQQVIVAGAEPGTAVYDSFAAIALPGPGETYRADRKSVV